MFFTINLFVWPFVMLRTGACVFSYVANAEGKKLIKNVNWVAKPLEGDSLVCLVIDLSSLPAGAYFVTLTTPTASGTQKLVVK